MTNKQTKKAKKPLQTSLGKAPGQNDKEEPDLSHLRKPIDTSIFGLKEVLKLLETATEEIKSYVTYECDIMYECRICRTIFRSLANFILHKRNYCQRKFLAYMDNCREDSTPERSYPPDPPEETLASGGKGLVPVIEKLKERQEIKQLSQELLSADLSQIKKENVEETNTADNDVLLEEIATNNAAVFQTVLNSLPKNASGQSDFMKNEVMEIHNILDSDQAVLGEDGKICNYQTNKLRNGRRMDMSCSECNLTFLTKKTLSCHLKSKHNNSRLVYVCPDCKDTFANAWSVFRHLYKVHRKSVAQVKRLRDQVHNSMIRKDQDPNKKPEKEAVVDKPDEENQWLNNIEGDNDFQMCGGCGKRFERKAALHSHATMCVKRIAVCNTINAKKKEEENKDKKNNSIVEKTEKPTTPDNSLKGAFKRKPYLLRTYKQPEKIDISSNNSDNKNEEDASDDKLRKNSDEKCDNICDVNDNNKINIECDDSITKNDITDDCSCRLEMESNNLLNVITNCDNTEISKDSESEFQSPGKISIKSLEELRGFPEEQQTLTDTDDMPVLEPSVSPKSPKKSPKRLSKRKRTTSLDDALTKKSFKRSSFDVLLDKQDLNFMAKASPYMDRSSLSCKSCHLKHQNMSKLLWHMSAHFSWFRFQCSRCSFVSFGKSECATHAKSVHSIKNSEISSVVLPIPNWKTLLMSNGFKELKTKDDLGGKHTDEVRSFCKNEVCSVDQNQSDAPKDPIDTLFIDSEVEEMVNDLDTVPVTDNKTVVKNESIDITENDENFQVEVPEEIYTLSVFEVINIDDNEEHGTVIKEEPEFDGYEDVNPSNSNELPKVKMECDDYKNPAATIVNNRPTRNRMRSIKTLQTDFFYDLGRITKPSDVKLNGPQRQKKNNSNVKKNKEMRVYSKGK